MSTENAGENKRAVQNTEQGEIDPMVDFETKTNIFMRNILAMSHLIDSGTVTVTPEQWKKFDALRDDLFRLKTHAAATL